MGIIFFLLIIAIIGILVIAHHRLLSQIEAIGHNRKKLDIEYEHRSKVLESLCSAIQKHISASKTPLKDFASLREEINTFKTQDNIKARIEAENKISAMTNGLGHALAQQPDVKADQHCMRLVHELTHIEKRLAFTRQSYNDSVDIYNANKKTFPATLLVSAFKEKVDVNFTPW